MKEFMIYEHIFGIPSHLDIMNEEITECAMLDCFDEEELEEYIAELNKVQPFDRFGRRRKLYIYWEN